MDLIIKPRQLTITWGDDDRYWEWIDGETPRLLSVYWFMIRGRFAMSRLTHGAKYQLTFEVELESWAKGWESPVTLKMVFPDGRSTTRVETLDHHPREQLLMLCVGEFEASGNGEIKFKMGETNDKKEKKGLVIRRVVIQPSSSTTPLERSALPRNPAPQSNPSASSQCALETPPAKQAKLMEQRKEEDEEGVEEEGNNESLSEDEDEEEHGDTLCGACGDNYAADEFWICCDVCERWFHGRCVKITPARAEHIKQYKCPSCSN